MKGKKPPFGQIFFVYLGVFYYLCYSLLNNKIMPKFKLKYLSGLDGEKCRINNFPNFHSTGSISGMKKLYYGESALLVKCGGYIFNVTSEPHIYHNIAKDKPYKTN